QLAHAIGQQKQNLAELENTRIQLQRYRDLAGGNYVSAQDVANLQAQVRQFEGRRESDQAAVDEARLQLEYTRIVAPIDGRVGLRSVDVGNLVRSGDADGIVTITQTRRSSAAARRRWRCRPGTATSASCWPPAPCPAWTTGSTPRPARCACAPCSTTPTTPCFPTSRSTCACAWAARK